VAVGDENTTYGNEKTEFVLATVPDWQVFDAESPAQPEQEANKNVD
jgi:hypothetical protein